MIILFKHERSLVKQEKKKKLSINEEKFKNLSNKKKIIKQAFQCCKVHD